MDKFLINGRDVSPFEWEQFRSIFEEMKGRTLPEVFGDGAVSKEEMFSVIDIDKSGRFDLNDVKGLRTGLFSNIEYQLKKYGIYDKDIALVAVKFHAPLLKEIDPKFRSDRDVAMASVAGNRNMWDDIDVSFRSDKGFVVEAIDRNIGIMERLDKKDGVSVDDIWPMFVKKYRDEIEKAGLLPYCKGLAVFQKGMKEIYNIGFIGRFRSPKIMFEVLARRLDNGPESSNLALVLGPKVDKKGAFADYGIIDRLAELGYVVKYYENATEQELKNNLEKATIEGASKATMIVISGHGDSRSLALGADDPSEIWKKNGREERYLDVSDVYYKDPDIDLSRYVMPDGDVFLDSCFSGSGGGHYNDDNLANSIAWVTPVGAVVHSITMSATIYSIEMDGNGKPEILYGSWFSPLSWSIYKTPGRMPLK